MHLLNRDADVMTKQFTECFVDLRGQAFTSQAMSELGFDHRELGFDV